MTTPPMLPGEVENRRHRLAIGQAIGADIPMRVFVNRNGFTVYAGMWATWWVNGTNIAAKILFATVPAAPGQLPQSALLGDLAWTVLQLQTVSPDSPNNLWERLSSTTLAEEFRPPAPAPSGTDRSRQMLSFDATQRDTYRLRKFAKPDVLETYRVVRSDPNQANHQPTTSLDRIRIPYNVFEYHRTPGSPPLDVPVRVFMERELPKQACVGHMLTLDTGYAREGTLLAAMGEWRTWIVLTAQ